MKKLYYFIVLICAISAGLQSCNDGKTYAEMKEEEADAINKYILDNDIKVISEKEFFEKDTMTAENEYVLFEESGVYMNIMCKGEGEILEEGTYDILSRFVEVCIKDVSSLGLSAGDTLLFNMHNNSYPSQLMYPEEFKVTIGSSGSYSATFQGYSSMYKQYQTTAVPSGWLVPLAFVKPVRTTQSDKLARVKIIVPHSEGTSYASRYVYPCLYEITYNLK
ncbi:MAG: DUF4827 domain-containing protein [Phocaeicola sp.]|nr:DUF4827 domain-containing protein [Phocaeicola sp.]